MSTSELEHAGRGEGESVIRITRRIVATEVAAAEPAPDAPAFAVMNEAVKRPANLDGTTYKIPAGDRHHHALYVTINNMVLNAGTRHEEVRPFEVFINSKNMDQFQWIVALTRIMSAVLRKGGDVHFLVEELKSVFDPGGGRHRNGRYRNSLIAEIGDALGEHLEALDARAASARRSAGAAPSAALPDRAPAEPAGAHAPEPEARTTDTPGPPRGERCPKCFTPGLRRSGGCTVCEECGYSSC